MSNKKTEKLSFHEKVQLIVSQIPKGKVMTYGQVAAAAGSVGAARAVGSIMAKNLNPAVPCHRVVRADGQVGKFNRAGGEKTKSEKLMAEGVDVNALKKFYYAKGDA